jgi:Zn-dependent protease
VSDLVLQLAIAVIPVVLAITLHEAAHGFAALALGDDTARQAGRLSINPLRHVDRFGTIILPGLLLIGQLMLPPHRVGFMFGWAKPVPVSAWKFRHPRQGMAVVAAAGPAMNFGLAWLAALAMPRDGLDDALMTHPLLGSFLFYFILSNLVLGLFNLIPIPPLDGGRIAVGLLPRPLALRWARLERAGLLLIILAVFLLPSLLRPLGIAFDPVGAALNHVVPWAIDLVLRLAGHNTGEFHV